MPLKAHAPHEPVIPPESRDVILVVGASGFGRPIAQAAHRPERYALLVDGKEEDPLTPEAAVRMVKAEGLHRKIFVNQAEENLASARKFAALVQGYIVLGSIQKGEIYPCSF